MPTATTEAAWAAWRAGNAEDAATLGERLSTDSAAANEGRHVAALAAHVRGDYAAAITHYEAIAPDYPRRRELRGVIFESFLHTGRPADALRFASETEMSANALARAQARLDNPMTVTIPGLIGLGFEDDALTPYMPGVAGRLNGQAAVFRFDTGGTFVAMSPALATRYNVRSAQCAEGFANLQATQVCQGVADIDLGPVRVTNAPVVVVSSLPAEQLGVELGPVLGTNFLQRFLATIDGPNQRLLLSPRGNTAANAQHMALVNGARTEVPFLLLSDHFIIARGGAGDRRDLNFFVDSGLVAIAGDGVQAGLLLPQSQASAWAGITDPSAAGAIVALAPDVSLGGASQSGQRAMVLADAAWGSFGTFGGIDVHGLISYGFLKHYAWTLDFERQVIVLTAVRDEP
ncbi:MAG: retropepsin-like aspartic protease [Terricaulis sp.]